MRQTLERGGALGIAKTPGLCRGLLKREEAMWNWAKVPGLEPTNNLAERMLRPAVITRKVGGCNKTLWGALVHSGSATGRPCRTGPG